MSHELDEDASWGPKSSSDAAYLHKYCYMLPIDLSLLKRVSENETTRYSAHYLCTNQFIMNKSMQSIKVFSLYDVLKCLCLLV